MKTKALARRVFPLLAAAILLTAGFVLAQEKRKGLGVLETAGSPSIASAKKPDVHPPCPKPFYLHLNANANDPLYPGDFTSAQLAAPRAGLDDPRIDRHFLYTFNWEPRGKCCQCTRAVLTVKMKANSPGTGCTSPDAGNDTISVMINGVSVQSQKVYAPPWTFPPAPPITNCTFPKDQSVTKTFTFTLTGDVLKQMCQNRRLSFHVQDDTMVLSQGTTLELIGCCVTP